MDFLSFQPEFIISILDPTSAITTLLIIQKSKIFFCNPTPLESRKFVPKKSSFNKDLLTQPDLDHQSTSG